MKRLYLVPLALSLLAFSACAISGPEAAKSSPAPLTTPAATVTSTAEMEKMIIDLEKKSWEPLKTKQVEEARKIAAPGFRAIYYGQIRDAEETFKDINDIDIKSILFSDWKVTFPIKDTAVITYKYDAKGSYKGADTSGASVVTSVWVNMGSEWKQAVYAESRAEPQPKK